MSPDGSQFNYLKSFCHFFFTLRFHQHKQNRRNERRRNFLNNDESMKSNVLTILKFCFVFLLIGYRVTFGYRIPFFLTRKKKKRKMLKRSSTLCYRSSGVVNSFTQEQHLMHIRVSVTLSRFHQNPLAIHQFKRYTVHACFWKKND